MSSVWYWAILAEAFFKAAAGAISTACIADLMAPQMSKTAAAAAVVAGTAFVALPSQRQAAPSATSALRGRAPSSVTKTTSNISTVGVALGATAMVALRMSEGRKASAASQLKAFENELGVQAPLGFWDPAGLSSDGDAREFYRRRVVELKHGRVSMLACTGALPMVWIG